MAGFTLSKEALQALRAGNAIEAIKIVRESTGVGLAEAAKAVETIRKEMAASGSRPTALKIGGMARVAAAAGRPAEGLAPGEASASGSIAKWFILIAIAATAIGAALY